jgi:hypothetical protein
MNMPAFIVYSNTYLLLFYATYYFALKKTKRHQLNRFLLIGIGLVSLLLPCFFISTSLVTSTLGSAKIGFNYYLAAKYAALLPSIYLIGLLLALFIFLIKILGVYWQISNTTAQQRAFSFLNTVYMDLQADPADTIFYHERAHATQLHTIDLLFYEILTIIFWFNPAVYGLKTELKNVHEYIADAIACKFTGNPSTYGMLLLTQKFGVSAQALVHPFFEKASLKDRLLMLGNTTTNPKLIVYLALPVAIFLGIYLQSTLAPAQVNYILGLPLKIQISGQLVGAKGLPVVGANIVVIPLNYTTQSNEFGQFNIKNIPNGSRLQVQHLKYQPKTLWLRGSQKLHLQLSPWPQNLQPYRPNGSK